MKNKKINGAAIVECILILILFAAAVLCNHQLVNTKSELDHKNSLLQHMQEELDTVAENLQLECIKSEELSAELGYVTKYLDETNHAILALQDTEYELIYMGEFKITRYCDEEYEHICGYGDSMTASGSPTEVDWTAAADWDVLPNGSLVYITGIGFREITDVGGDVNGKHIDVLVQNHDNALDLGVDYKDVWLLIEKSS